MHRLRLFFTGIVSFAMATSPALGMLAADDARAPRPLRPERPSAPHSTTEVLVRFAGKDRFERVPVPAGASVESVLTRFMRRGDVLFSEPNYIAHTYAVPNDPYYAYQWNFNNDTYGGIHMEPAWDNSTGSGVTVAVIDTGVAYEDYARSYARAPDLADTVFVAGYDFVNNDTHPNDDNGHGTHVAGTIAQSTNNGIGVAGIAHTAAIMPVKVLSKNGSGSYADVADGIYWAVDNGADVINLSLGGSAPSLALENAVAYAYTNGVTVIAAAGNDNGPVGYPAAYDEYVIAVGAVRYDETRSFYSNYGTSLDIVAPGGDLNIDQNGDGYGDGILQQTFSGNNYRSFGYYFYHGTSMASPHAAGVAALVLANGNASTPDEVRDALQMAADDKGTAGRDDFYGWGLLNAAAALGYVSGSVDNPPSVTLAAPADGSIVSGTVLITADASDDNAVEHVDFYIGGALAAADSTAPYEYAWDTATSADGAVSISVVAADSAAQSASDSITVTVDNINDPPVAHAGADSSVADTDGNGSEEVTLDGSGSFDTDGTIASYEWYEGATLLGAGKTFSVNFPVGSTTILLVVTDDGGAVDSDDVSITVLNNSMPAADAGSDKTAFVGEKVSFNGSGSTDDGTIVSYEWDFGDGTPPVAGVSATHSYAAAGVYTAALTIVDNGGRTDTDTAVIEITEPPAAPTAYLSIDISSSGRFFWRADAVVTAVGETGTPITGLLITGEWSGVFAGVDTGTTDSSGAAHFRSDRTRTAGTGTFTVTGASKDGTEYMLAGETSGALIGGFRF